MRFGGRCLLVFQNCLIRWIAGGEIFCGWVGQYVLASIAAEYLSVAMT